MDDSEVTESLKGLDDDVAVVGVPVVTLSLVGEAGLFWGSLVSFVLFFFKNPRVGM